MFSSASWSLSSATSAPSSSSSACWLAGVCSCLLLFQQTCHWHHSYKWCLMKFCLRIHHTVSRRHLNPHCLVHLPHQAALEHVGLLHGEIYFFSIMLHQTVLPDSGQSDSHICYVGKKLKTESADPATFILPRWL